MNKDLKVLRSTMVIFNTLHYLSKINNIDIRNFTITLINNDTASLNYNLVFNYITKPFKISDICNMEKDCKTKTTEQVVLISTSLTNLLKDESNISKLDKYIISANDNILNNKEEMLKLISTVTNVELVENITPFDIVINYQSLIEDILNKKLI